MILDSISVKKLSLRDSCEIRRLGEAACGLGFFTICDFEEFVPEQQISAIMTEAKHFFALPLDVKDQIHMRHSTCYRGWSRVDEEYTLGLPDHKETVDFMPDGVDDGGGISGPNQWPSDGAKKVTEEFVRQMCIVGKILLETLALAIGKPEDYFVCKFENPYPLLRWIRYPPAKDQEGFGIGEHTDYGCLTIISQDEVGGLEVQLVNNQEWVAVEPVAGTMVVNLGDTISCWSEGMLKATPHRVKNQTRERYSVPFFFEPSLDAQLFDGLTYEKHLLKAYQRSYPKLSK